MPTRRKRTGPRQPVAARYSARQPAIALRLEPSRASTGAPCPAPRRVLTSTSATSPPRRQTRSISPWRQRKLRAVTSQPWPRRSSAASSSPASPSRRRRVSKLIDLDHLGDRSPGHQLPHPPPGGAVDRARAQEADRLLVGGGGVALVEGEPVARELAVEVDHLQ